ncbi:UNVERIFIED_CONTAM: hypothetical protein GTU68_001175 [Idotea baltica]|nr:hypothetical protein [Idotea baltica]
MSDNPFAKIPAVEKVLHALETGTNPLPPIPRPLIAETVREEVESLRADVKGGKTDVADFETIVTGIRETLTALHRSRIHTVINGTGIIIHTNLGRSPMSAETVERISASARYYNNIELDLNTGERGPRGGFLERSLRLLCEAEAATVVNNCAAALILILRYLANGEKNEVIISRGELVEIGGGFRVPEIMETSGAKLREVGATNKTSLADYEKAINPNTGMLLKVHRSNFWMDGFIGEPTTEELVELGKKHGIPVVEDLGSGAMIQTDQLAPIPHEPTAAEVLKRGVDLVCVSGDKLFGGAQAGIIAGRADLVAGLKKEPFFRALRCDKMILTAMQTVVSEYLSATEKPNLPLPTMLSLKPEDLKPRAEKIIAELGDNIPVSIGEGISRCGGGTMPKAEIPSLTLDFRPENMSLDKLAKRLREGQIPVMGYKSDDGYRIDLRTVFPEQDEELIENLKAAFNG